MYLITLILSLFVASFVRGNPKFLFCLFINFKCAAGKNPNESKESIAAETQLEKLVRQSFALSGAKRSEALKSRLVVTGATSFSYNYTGAPVTFVVPTGVTLLTVEAYGAAGASSSTGTGGLGGFISSTISVTPGQILYANVGGAGGTYKGGYNGGGAGYCVDMTMALGAGGGGGSTDLTDSAGNLLVTAGGGGGGAYDGSTTGINGGGGGALTGQAGSSNPNWPGSWGGGGGSQLSGGIGGYISDYYNAGQPGGYRLGGDAGLLTCGAGGGGGYYGGGGGSWTGGGGGSSYSVGSVIDNIQSVQLGDGFLVLSYTFSPSTIPSGPLLDVASKCVLICLYAMRFVCKQVSQPSVP